MRSAHGSVERTSRASALPHAARPTARTVLKPAGVRRPRRPNGDHLCGRANKTGACLAGKRVSKRFDVIERWFQAAHGFVRRDIICSPRFLRIGWRSGVQEEKLPQARQILAYTLIYFIRINTSRSVYTPTLWASKTQFDLSLSSHFRSAATGAVSSNRRWACSWIWLRSAWRVVASPRSVAAICA